MLKPAYIISKAYGYSSGSYGHYRVYMYVYNAKLRKVWYMFCTCTRICLPTHVCIRSSSDNFKPCTCTTTKQPVVYCIVTVATVQAVPSLVSPTVCVMMCKTWIDARAILLASPLGFVVMDGWIYARQYWGNPGSLSVT